MNPSTHDDDRRPMVLTVVGTDRHRFDRLMTWLERWYHARDPEQSRSPRAMVQHGFSRIPDMPDTVDFLGHGELQEAMSTADLVVSHGGPATVTEARRQGHLPLVVPRDPEQGEHVDAHQQQFARRLGHAGMVALCEQEETFTAALDRGLAEPARFRIGGDTTDGRLRAEAIARVGRIVEELEAGEAPSADTGQPRVPAQRRRS